MFVAKPRLFVLPVNCIAQISLFHRCSIDAPCSERV